MRRNETYSRHTIPCHWRIGLKTVNLHRLLKHILALGLPKRLSVSAGLSHALHKDRPTNARTRLAFGESEQIATEFGWPVFVKGVRQTSGHRKSLSIIEGPDMFEQAMQVYRFDPILQWQGIVLAGTFRYAVLGEIAVEDRIPSSFEFRTFWWKGTLVGYGRYWWESEPYGMTAAEKAAALGIA